MSIADYTPHGMIAAFAAVVGWVYKAHVKQDDDRYKQLTDVLGKVFEGQTEIRTKMADNHADLLKLLLQQPVRRRNK
jgi:hypothetical protein